MQSRNRRARGRRQKTEGTELYEGGLDDECQRHGFGIFVWPTGDKYSGQWMHGAIHGKGSFVWAEGDVYEGQWQAGEMHGAGIKQMAAGSKYVL